MRIHKEGYIVILIFGVALSLLDLGFFYLTSEYIFAYVPFIIASVIFYFFIVRFFRYPKREISEFNNNIIYAPADGRIVVIEDINENEYFKDKRTQISIFMSPLNVHVNRYSIGGIIKYFKYHPGNFLLAINPKSSELNERTSVVIENENGVAIMLKQIAGYVARRIVSYAKLDLKVKQGEDLGFIKFGSRVDIIVPIGTEIIVKLDQEVKGNKTIIAILK